MVPVEKCSAQSCEMTASVWDLEERKGCVREKAKRKSRGQKKEQLKTSDQCQQGKMLSTGTGVLG